MSVKGTSPSWSGVFVVALQQARRDLQRWRAELAAAELAAAERAALAEADRLLVDRVLAGPPDRDPTPEGQDAARYR